MIFDTNLESLSSNSYWENQGLAFLYLTVVLLFLILAATLSDKDPNNYNYTHQNLEKVIWLFLLLILVFDTNLVSMVLSNEQEERVGLLLLLYLLISCYFIAVSVLLRPYFHMERMEAFIKESDMRTKMVPHIRSLQSKDLEQLRQQQESRQDTERDSAVGINYNKLRELLREKRWQEADRETEAIIAVVGSMMLQAFKNPGENIYFHSKEHYENIPCRDLRTIDQLWVEASEGRFGFSVKKQIFQGLVERDGPESEGWTTFESRMQIGRKSIPEIRYYATNRVPAGYFPRTFPKYLTIYQYDCEKVFRRMEDCNVK